MIFAVDFEAHALEISSYVVSLNENALKNVKNGPKMVKTRSS